MYSYEDRIRAVKLYIKLGKWWSTSRKPFGSKLANVEAKVWMFCREVVLGSELMMLLQ